MACVTLQKSQFCLFCSFAHFAFRINSIHTKSNQYVTAAQIDFNIRWSSKFVLFRSVGGSLLMINFYFLICWTFRDFAFQLCCVTTRAIKTSKIDLVFNSPENVTSLQITSSIYSDGKKHLSIFLKLFLLFFIFKSITDLHLCC